MTAAPSPRRVAWPVKLFVLFHAVAVLAWTLPRFPPPGSPADRPPGGSDYILTFNQTWLKDSPIQWYMLSTGFWQYWDMFAPNPADTDRWCDAEITYRDGAKTRYTYPRMIELSYTERYFKERYRKFYERAGAEENAFLWPAFAQRIALVNFKNPENPPVQVLLRRHWRHVMPPGRPQPEAYDWYDYFQYVVDQPRLFQDAGRG